LSNSEELILASKIFSSDDSVALVVFKNKEEILRKQGKGVRPLFEAVDSSLDDLLNSTVGDRMVGRASALLCLYAHVTCVYAYRATQEAIQLLQNHDVEVLVGETIERISGRDGTGCIFEKMLADINDPEIAFQRIRRFFIGKQG